MIDTFLRDLRQPEYVHVLLNPIPIYGLAIALIGLLIAMLMRSRPGQIVALSLVLISAGMAWPVAELGERSSDRVLSMSDDDGQAWLKAHEHRADQFVPFFYALAVVSLLAIVLPIKFPKSSFPLTIVTLLFGFVVLGMGAYIAQAGGKIRHREFRSVPPPKGERGEGE
jgi:disulfide bond formation protein DsbB